MTSTTRQARRPRYAARGVSHEPARSVLTKPSGFMDQYDFTVNPYNGCTFSCIYCYAAFFQGSQEHTNNWGQWANAKTNAAELLEKEIKKSPKILDGKQIYFGSVTDPYQPLERKERITRQLLTVMANGVSYQPDLNNDPEDAATLEPKPTLYIQTRSSYVTEDIYLFKAINSNGGHVRINMTITNDSHCELSRRECQDRGCIRHVFEPACQTIKQRLTAIGEIKAAEVDACITLTPLIWLDDPEQFAVDLLDTGVDQFIVQPFKRKGAKFTAGTRNNAVALLEDKLFPDYNSYEEAYQRWLEILQSEGVEFIGEAKAGFAPVARQV